MTTQTTTLTLTITEGMEPPKGLLGVVLGDSATDYRMDMMQPDIVVQWLEAWARKIAKMATD